MLIQRSVTSRWISFFLPMRIKEVISVSQRVNPPVFPAARPPLAPQTCTTNKLRQSVKSPLAPIVSRNKNRLLIQNQVYHAQRHIPAWPVPPAPHVFPFLPQHTEPATLRSGKSPRHGLPQRHSEGTYILRFQHLQTPSNSMLKINVFFIFISCYL